MIIKTKRFELRLFTTNNVTERYLSWLTEEGAGKYICFPKNKVNMDNLIQYVSIREGREDVLFLAIFTNNNLHIGNIKYEPINFKTKIATMGILIGEKAWQGKGVAFEVIKAGNKFLKKKHGINRILLGVDRDNIAACSAYKKIGFKIVSETDSGFKMSLSLE